MLPLLLIGLCWTIVTALSFSRSENNLRYIPVSHLQITPPSPHSEAPSWKVNLSFDEHCVELYLTEDAIYNDDDFCSITAHGEARDVSTDPAGGGLGIGKAQMVFDTSDPASIRTQGCFSMSSVEYHLQASPQYRVWFQTTLQSRSADFSPGDSDESKLISGEGGGFLWSTQQELHDLLVHNASQSCFALSKVARIGVVADSSFLRKFQSLNDARLHIVDTVNKASMIWKNSFNISLNLGEIVLALKQPSGYPWDSPCQRNASDLKPLESRLKALTKWREETRSNDGFAFWTQFTNCPSGDIVGLAWEATLCKNKAANILHHTALDYRVLTHEIGHIFGAVHDCNNQTCGSGTVCCPSSPQFCDANNKFLMSPETTESQTLFSNCTRQSLCSAVMNGQTDQSCLINAYTLNSTILRRKDCEAMIDPVMRSQCMRDKECNNYVEHSVFCGNIGSCKLSCTNPETQQCLDLGQPLLDGTPCGDMPVDDSGHNVDLCYNGLCRNTKTKRKHIWYWFVLAIGITAGLLLASYLANLVYSRCAFRRPAAEKAQREGAVSISWPQQRPLSEHRLIRNSNTGLPPFLKYNSMSHDDGSRQGSSPSTSTSSASSASSFTISTKYTSKDHSSFSETK